MNSLVVIPDFAATLAGRPKRAKMFVRLNSAPLHFETSGHRLILHDPAAFYIIDTTQFDDATPPAELRAVRINRFGIIDSMGYGHRSDDKERGATAMVTASPGAIHEVLKIDHSWWDEKKDNERLKEAQKRPIDYCA